MVSETQQDISHNLSKLALAGFSWQLLSRISRQLVQFFISIILARLLLPMDYGLVGMVAVFVTITQSVSDLGFTGAIVQKKDVTDEQFQTVFWLNNLASLSIWAMSWLTAPLIAHFYNEPAVAPIFIASTLGMVLMAPSGVPRSLIYKKMQFKDSFIMDWVGMLLGGVTSIMFAFWGYGAWSLVFGNLATAMIVAVVVWRFCPWRPRWVWKPASLKEMTKFSTHYLGTRMLQGLTGNLDYMVIGKFFSATELGFYFLAFRLMELPRVQLGLVIQSVMYPVFIHLQENDERTQEVLYKLGLTISLLVFPALTLLMILAPSLITLVYGQKWSESAILLRLLVGAGMFSAVDQSVFVMNARGKAEWVFWSTVIRAGLFLVFVLFGAAYGLNYVAVLVSLHSILTTLLYQFWVNRLTGFTYSQYLQSLAPAIFVSALMCLAVWGVQSVLFPLGWNPWIVLSLQVLFGGFTFGLAILIWPPDDIRQTVLWLQMRIPKLAQSTLLTDAIQRWGAWRFHQSGQI